MFVLQLISGDHFMKVKSLIRAFECFEAIVDISSTGFTLQANDSSNGDTMVLHLSPNAFDHFHCDHNISMGIGIYWMLNLLECSFDGYTVMIDGDNGTDTIFLSIRGFREDEILLAAYKLWKNENERFNIHEGEYEMTVAMPSVEFKCICKILQGFSNTATISVVNERVKFSARVDNGSADSNLPKCINSLDVPKETATVQTDLTDLVSFSFSLGNRHSFAMATSLSNTVMIRMSSGLPVMLEYMIEQNGYMRFYLS